MGSVPDNTINLQTPRAQRVFHSQGSALAPKKGFLMQLAFIGAITMSILGVVFAMQNNVPVTVNLLVWRFDSTLAMILLMAIAFGAAVVSLLTTPMTLKRHWQTNRLLRQVAELEKTCDLQRGRIADLQRQIPAESVGEDPKPYVGLKQLLTGNSDTPAGDRTP